MGRTLDGRAADGSAFAVRRVASAWALSFVVHAALIGGGAALALRSLSVERAQALRALTFSLPNETLVQIELPEVAEGSIAKTTTEASPDPAPAPRGGGEAMPRPDMGHAGRGGTDTAERAAINLADRDDGLLLSREVASRFDRSQIQRIKSARERASREDWRASREPMQLTFLASGKDGFGQPERRTPAAFDPSAGARESGAALRAGTALGGGENPAGFGEAAHDLGSPNEGAEHATAGLGVRDGAPGWDHRDSARVPLARPMVPEGTPSIPAQTQGKPKDNVDGEQEVATMVESLVHASTAGGAAGNGPGGQQGAGATGSGGVHGQGSVANAMGTGRGSGVDVDPRDKRRNLYLRQVIAKVYPLYSLPKWAALEGMQGTAIVSFTILADGSVTGVRVSRSSGIAEYDENCRQAVLHAAPYPPLPSELGTSLRWSMPLEARNPAVRPKSASAERARLQE
jgi:TonB family protein